MSSSFSGFASSSSGGGSYSGPSLRRRWLHRVESVGKGEGVCGGGEGWRTHGPQVGDDGWVFGPDTQRNPPILNFFFFSSVYSDSPSRLPGYASSSEGYYSYDGDDGGSYSTSDLSTGVAENQSELDKRMKRIQVGWV